MFILKQYDNSIINFEICEDPINGQSCHIVSVNEDLRHLIPIGMELSDEGIMSWLKSRIIPKNREFVQIFLSKQGLAANDVKGIIRVCLGLSLNDAYWIVEDQFDGLFKDYNLFEHDFVKALSLIAYTGYGSSRAHGFTSSPEFTTAGMLRKGWRRLGGKILLFKGGSNGAANTGREPYSELMASQIAEQMGIDHVTYNLSKWKHELCSTCELFCDIDHSYVPIYRFVSKRELRSVAEYLKTLGDDYYDRFVDMLIFDALIYNEDRHLGNYGLIVDNHSNKPCGFAPLFDHGLSLFNYAMDEDIDNIEEYRKTRLTANGVPFDNVAKEFITSRQKKMLRRMIGFEFRRHPSYNLPVRRTRLIQEFIQKRAAELLEM